jgi:hypothetical protein
LGDCTFLKYFLLIFVQALPPYYKKLFDQHRKIVAPECAYAYYNFQKRKVEATLKVVSVPSWFYFRQVIANIKKEGLNTVRFYSKIHQNFRLVVCQLISCVKGESCLGMY